jgi:TolB-like protein/class 3 adenylate cyclase/rhodanese-related sulfurtransferase
MEKDHLSRKLAVIIHADVVDSTALVRLDETITHERIQDTFRRFSETIRNHGGIAHEIRGDALVAEFARASDAISAALDFQSANSSYIEGLQDEIRPVVRVGIAMGEVVVANNTVTGEGIVLAQRLEQLASPGGVCIQGAAYETVPKRLPVEYEDLGELELKGFDDPVRVYRVELSPGESIPLPRPPTRRKKIRQRLVPALALIVGIMAVILVITNLFQPAAVSEEPASLARMAFPLPDKPSIAVLPFINMSADAEQEYFVDGLTDDLITDLSKLPGLFVVARNSTFTYKGKSVKVRQVAEELGVRYVLEGNVRRADDKVRINVQLIDATTGGHKWTERYDGSLVEIFALQDKITRSIVAELALKLTVGEQQRQAKKGTNSPEAQDAFFKGRAHYQLFTPDDLAKAIPYLESAIELDPGFAQAHAVLAATYFGIWDNIWAESTGVSYDDAFKKAKFHIDQAMKDPTPLAHRIKSRQLEWEQRFDEALAEAESAIILDPNDPNGYEAMGLLQVNLGRADDGLEYIKKAMRLDPQSDYLWSLGWALFHLERYDEAAATFHRATKTNPDYHWTYLLLAATYGHLGRENEARSAITTFDNMFRDPRDPQHTFVLSDLEYHLIIKDKAGLERLREGLIKAGIPEGITGKPANLEFTDLVTMSAGTFDVEGAIKIDATTAKSLHERGVFFFDSRGKYDYERGHIPGATNLLFHQVWGSLVNIVDRDAEIVFYCTDPKCHLAANSSAQALILGYTRVYYFAAGFSAWQDAGYPVEGS